MEIALGAILAAGHPLEVLDRWSWDEVELAASAITSYHAHVLSSVFAGLAPSDAETPSQPKPTRTGRKSKSKRTKIDRQDLDSVKRAQERDAVLLRSLGALGFNV
jgi:hypothetical protein